MQINQRSTIHQTLKQNRLINFIGSDTYIKSISNIPKNPEDSTPNCNEEKLLHALALSILQKKAANIEAQGWGWVHVAIDYPCDLACQMKKIKALSIPDTTVFSHDIAALEKAITELTLYSESAPNAEQQTIMEQFTELVSKQNQLFAKRNEFLIENAEWNSDEKKLAGCILSISPFDGVLEIDGGLVREQDFTRLEKLSGSIAHND